MEQQNAESLTLRRSPALEGPNSCPLTTDLVADSLYTETSLDPELWDALVAASRHQGCSINSLMTLIDGQRKQNQTMTSAIAVFLVRHYPNAADEAERIGEARTRLTRLIRQRTLQLILSDPNRDVLRLCNGLGIHPECLHRHVDSDQFLRYLAENA